MAFNADGTRLFVAYSGNEDDIVEYSLTTGFDVDGGDTYEGYYSPTYSGSQNLSSIAFSHDGTKMFHGDFQQKPSMHPRHTRRQRWIRKFSP